MTTGHADSPLAFSLTFCRPLRLILAQGQELFGTLSDGSNSVDITTWPAQALPFGVTASSVLCLRIYAARDSIAFSRRRSELLGSCAVPLFQVAALPQTQQGLFRLWLGLDSATSPRQSADAAVGFELNRQAATNQPLRPKICIIVQPRQDDSLVSRICWSSSGAGPPITSERSALPLSKFPLGGRLIGVSPPISKEPLSSAAGSSVCSGEDDGLRSEKFATAVGTQPAGTAGLASTSSATSTSPQLQGAKSPRGTPKALTGTGARSPTRGKSPVGGRSPRAISPRPPWNSGTASAKDLHVDVAKSSPKTSGSMPASPRLVSRGLSRELSSPSSPKRTPTPPPGMQNPQRLPNEFTVTWQTRWAEEHARIERLAVEFERRFRASGADGRRKTAALTTVATSFANSCSAFHVRQQLIAWRIWMLEEKATRQFAQMTDEFENQQAAHEHEKKEAAEMLKTDAEQQQEKVAETSKYKRHDSMKTDFLDLRWGKHAEEDTLSVVLLAWREYLKKFRVIKNHGIQCCADAVGEFRHVVYRVWWSMVVKRRRDEQLAESQALQAHLPIKHAQELLRQTVLALSQVHAGHDETACQLLLSDVLATWSKAAARKSLWLGCAECLIGNRSGGTSDINLLLRAFNAWYCVVDDLRTAATVDRARRRWISEADSFRQHAMVWVLAADSASIATKAILALRGWRGAAAAIRAERALAHLHVERDSIEQSAIPEQLLARRDEADKEKDKWQTQLASVENKIQSSTAAASDFQEAIQRQEADRVQLEEIHEQELSKSSRLANELREVQISASQLSERLGAVRSVAEERSQGVMNELGDIQQQLRDAEDFREGLHSEIARHREGRNHELKEIKAQAKAEMTSHENMSREMMAARGVAHEAWASELGSCDGKRRRLEQEMRTLRRSLASAQPRGYSVEIEQQSVQQRMLAAQQKLDQIHSDSHQEEIETFKTNNVDLQKECEELEAELKRRRARTDALVAQGVQRDVVHTIAPAPTRKVSQAQSPSSPTSNQLAMDLDHLAKSISLAWTPTDMPRLPSPIAPVAPPKPASEVGSAASAQMLSPRTPASSSSATPRIQERKDSAPMQVAHAAPRLAASAQTGSPLERSESAPFAPLSDSTQQAIPLRSDSTAQAIPLRSDFISARLQRSDLTAGVSPLQDDQNSVTTVAPSKISSHESAIAPLSALCRAGCPQSPVAFAIAAAMPVVAAAAAAASLGHSRSQPASPSQTADTSPETVISPGTPDETIQSTAFPTRRGAVSGVASRGQNSLSRTPPRSPPRSRRESQEDKPGSKERSSPHVSAPNSFSSAASMLRQNALNQGVAERQHLQEMQRQIHDSSAAPRRPYVRLP